MAEFIVMLRRLVGEADHDEIEKRLKELVDEGHIQSAKQKLRYVGVRTVYWK